VRHGTTSRLAHIKAALSGLVTDGTLTQAQGDTLKSSLTERIPDQVNGVRAGGGMGRGLQRAPTSMCHVPRPRVV